MDDGSAPFGYHIESPEGKYQNTKGAQGPPLLNNEENSILDTFFENPNESDPNQIYPFDPDLRDFFKSQEGAALENQGTASNLGLRGSHTYDWMLPGRDNGFLDSSNSLARSLIAPGPDHTSPSTEHLSPTSPQDLNSSLSYQLFSDPNSQLRRKGGNGYESFRGYSNSGHPATLPNSAQTREEQIMFPNPGLYPPSYPPFSTTNDRMATANASRGDGGNRFPPLAYRGQPLNWGSDQKFRDTGYSGPKVDERDALGTSAITKQMAEDVRPGSSLLHAQSRRAPERRRKPDLGEVEEDDEIEEETTRPTKRFKGTRIKTVDYMAYDASDQSPTSARSDNKAQRNVLSEDQKRQNHITSEQKRRDAIKGGFEEIRDIVAELRSSAYSKSGSLVEAAAFAEELAKGNEALQEVLSLH